MPARRSDRSRFFYPLFLSALLFAIWWFLQRNPRIIPSFGDLRDVLGSNLKVLLFIAYIPLFALIVRAFDSFVFGLAISRRRKIPVPPLLRDIVALVLYAILIASALNAIFEYKLGSLLAGGAVVAAILGLALQDTLGNLFAGIALHLEDSFEVGDVIHSGEHMGRVEHVSWRATRVRTFNNDVVLLPNALLSRERLEVFPRGNLNARVISIPVDYHVPPAHVIDVLRRAAAHVDGVAREMPCFARVVAFGDSSITYEIKYYVRDYMLREQIDADIRKAVWYAMRRNNISMPFPVRAFQPYTPPQHDHGVELETEEIIERLREVDILAPLSGTGLDFIADAATVHVYSKGETIISHGGGGSEMFVVHRGTVSIRVPQNGTHEAREVAQLSEGSVFGEMALLTGEARSADVVALTDVTTIEIGKSALQPVLSDHPELARAISSKVAERRDKLEGLRSESEEAEESVLSRIRAYFGL